VHFTPPLNNITNQPPNTPQNHQPPPPHTPPTPPRGAPQSSRSAENTISATRAAIRPFPPAAGKQILASVKSGKVGTSCSPQAAQAATTSRVVGLVGGDQRDQRDQAYGRVTADLERKALLKPEAKAAGWGVGRPRGGGGGGGGGLGQVCGGGGRWGGGGVGGGGGGGPHVRHRRDDAEHVSFPTRRSGGAKVRSTGRQAAETQKIRK